MELDKITLLDLLTPQIADSQGVDLGKVKPESTLLELEISYPDMFYIFSCLQRKLAKTGIIVNLDSKELLAAKDVDEVANMIMEKVSVATATPQGDFEI